MFVTTFGQKGGVAKTCTSIHLAAHWANAGRSVVLVDADRNRSATAYAYGWTAASIKSALFSLETIRTQLTNAT